MTSDAEGPGMKPLDDDTGPRDIARVVGSLFDRLAAELAAGGPTPETRAAWAEEMTRAAGLMKAWAEYGRFHDPRSEKERHD